MDDLAYTESLNNTNYFAKGGAHNMNNMNKRYYAEGGASSSLPINVRYNNPGNLRPPTMKNANDWWGEGAVTSIDSGNGFAIFSSPEEGIRALKQQIRVDAIDRDKTIEELIYKFAPPDDDNPTDAYAANMAKALGLEVDDKISKDQIDDFAAAIIRQEGGPSGLDNYKDFLPESSVSNARLSFGIDKAGDNIAIALGQPTSEEIAALNPNYGNMDFMEYNNSSLKPSTGLQSFNTNNENMPTQDPKEPEYSSKKTKLYGETVDGIESMLNNLFMNDDYQVGGKDAISIWDNGTKERMAWLAKKVPTIAAAMKPYGGPGERFAIDRALVKDNIHEILNELNQITDGDDERSYGERVYTNPNAPGDTGSDDDFLSPNQLDDLAQLRKEQYGKERFPETDVGREDYSSMFDNAEYAPEYEQFGPKRPSMVEAERMGDVPMTQEEFDQFNNEYVNPYTDPPQITEEPNVAAEEIEPEEIERLRALASEERMVGNPSMPIDYDAEFQKVQPQKDKRDNLNRPDYNNLISSLGSYAARMAPLAQALRDANSYDRVRYPSISPALPTAHAQRNEVNTAFNTAQNAARLQGKLDLGALSALATQQAKSVAGVEENVANARIGILNQAEQYNNQNAIRGMIDEAGNKGAAGTMKYQALAAMSQMGQGSLREYNMQRNDANVKKMFEDVFDEKFSQYKS